jgi:hypothetical protein
MKNSKHLYVAVKGHIDDEDFIFIVSVIRSSSTLRSNIYIFPKGTVAYSTPEKCLEYSQENYVSVNYWDIVFDMYTEYEVIGERLIKC